MHTDKYIINDIMMIYFPGFISHNYQKHLTHVNYLYYSMKRINSKHVYIIFFLISGKTRFYVYRTIFHQKWNWTWLQSIIVDVIISIILSYLMPSGETFQLIDRLRRQNNDKTLDLISLHFQEITFILGRINLFSRIKYYK